MTNILENLVASTDVLAAMITPAVLISASGTLVLSTSNRLSRVVDRVRVLTRDAESLPKKVEEKHAEAKRALLVSQLSGLAERAVLLRSALAALYLAIGFLVATSLGIGLLTLIGSRFIWAPILLALVGACSLLWASVLLVREGRLAIGSTLAETQYAHRVIGELPTVREQ